MMAEESLATGNRPLERAPTERASTVRTKGARPSIEPIALRLYAEGHSIAEISRRLDVSETTLHRWKEASGVPGNQDEWDRAREQKRGNTTRLKDLFERQLTYVEGLGAHEVTPPMMDCLAKLGALVGRWHEIEQVVSAVAHEMVKEAKTSGGLTEEKAELIKRKILGIV
jgi:AraC-like DNA-binding protein